MHKVLRELAFFIGLFVFLAMGMHMDKWVSSPMDHLHALSSHTLPTHPLIYTFVIYVGLALLRGLFSLLVRLFFGNKN